jgi:hypothetical protein
LGSHGKVAFIAIEGLPPGSETNPGGFLFWVFSRIIPLPHRVRPAWVAKDFAAWTKARNDALRLRPGAEFDATLVNGIDQWDDIVPARIA